MPKLFLSYAEEDSERARRISELLKANLGWEIADWQDPKQRGRQWIQKIDKDILEANAFIALISPHYQTSPWCTIERDLALLQHLKYKKVGRNFLWVAQVAPTPKIGLLATFDWIDLAQSNWEQNLLHLIEGLKEKMDTSSAPLSSPETPSVAWPTFQNRREELDDLVGNLTNVAGKHFWQILSAPQMGKTWLLKRLPIELTEKEKDANWQIVLVDLREQPLDARSNLTILLSLFFKQELRGPISNDQITSLARHLAKQNTPWLCLLDSAELLADETAKALREHLSTIYGLLEESGKSKARLAFVAASRCPIPSWRSVIPAPPFVTRTLSHFSVGVIATFLRDMATLDGSVQNHRWFQEKSRQLSRASEGLPGLLVNYLDWIRNTAGYIIKPREIESQALFTSLAEPYANQHLLSANSLLPSSEDSDLIEPRRALLAKVLLGLSIYRCFTEKYFHQFLEDNGGLLAELGKADWTREQLWNALRKTYLLEPSQDIWVRLYPAVRRLLFRYGHPSHREQAEAHYRIAEYYRCSPMDLSGTDKAVVLIERLWHQAECQRLAGTDPDSESLKDFAEELFTEGIRSNHHTDRDLAVLIEERLHEDQELQQALAEIQKDLFSEIVGFVNQYNS